MKRYGLTEPCICQAMKVLRAPPRYALRSVREVIPMHILSYGASVLGSTALRISRLKQSTRALACVQQVGLNNWRVRAILETQQPP